MVFQDSMRIYWHTINPDIRVFSVLETSTVGKSILAISLIDLSKVKCLGQMTRIMVICGQHVNEHSICLNTI